MTQLRSKGEGALIATAAHLVLSAPAGAERELWVALLDEVLFGLEDVSAPLIPIKVSAEAVLEAETPTERSAAADRLRIEVRAYYRQVAADRIDVLRRARREAAA